MPLIIVRSFALVVLAALAALPASAQTLEDAFGSMKVDVKAGAVQRPPAARPAGVPVAAAAVDLIAQTGYPRGAPDQGPIGNCHEFAATALLNAAYYRQFRTSIRFSPGDLFIQSILLDNAYARYIHGNPLQLTEGGFPDKDLDTALAHGVSPESDLPYPVFAREYLAKILPANALDMDRRDMSGSLTKLANMAELAKFKFEQGDERAYEAVLAAREQMSAEQIERNRAIIYRRFRGRWPEIERERARYKSEFQQGGFAVVRKDFPLRYPAKDLPVSENVSPETMLAAREIRSKDNCRHAGGPQKDYLVEQLNAGRPVAVGFDLYDFSEWGFGKGKGGGHAFVIVGYEPGRDGLVFKTLNSWGTGRNYPIPEYSLCRMLLGTVLRTASDPQ